MPASADDGLGEFLVLRDAVTHRSVGLLMIARKISCDIKWSGELTGHGIPLWLVFRQPPESSEYLTNAWETCDTGTVISTVWAPRNDPLGAIHRAACRFIRMTARQRRDAQICWDDPGPRR